MIRLRRRNVPVRIRRSVVQIEVERTALRPVTGVAASIGIALRIPSAISASHGRYTLREFPACRPGISFRRAAALLEVSVDGSFQWEGREVSPPRLRALPLSRKRFARRRRRKGPVRKRRRGVQSEAERTAGRPVTGVAAPIGIVHLPVVRPQPVTIIGCL